VTVDWNWRCAEINLEYVALLEENKQVRHITKTRCSY